ncbi:MAG: helicase-related protein [Acidobacteriota bacterium]
MNPGSIVRSRNREWVLLPSPDENVYLLRPLTGATDDVVAIHKGLTDLAGYDLPEERVRSATFPAPTPDDLSDAAGSHLLWQAARLTLREGASPFRSLGRISIRPRTYQFVPLLMALRLDPVRLLIADDVGVGKTIEALIIARELWERGEIRRLCVLCPPSLCDQWQRALTQKANLEAVVVRSGTVGHLERLKPRSKTIYEHFPVIVASIDYLKSDRNRHQFLVHCPEMVIIDEAHGASPASNESQQQRYELVQAVSADPRRHVMLLTATPHSGITSAFNTLLSLLRPEFGRMDVGNLKEPERIELAKHFVQRTRKDIEGSWQGAGCFPKRDPEDASYHLSPLYKEFFDKTFAFCGEIVSQSQGLAEPKRRVHYWAALALLRCAMSSPRAALAALEERKKRQLQDGEDLDERERVMEASDGSTSDETPVSALDPVEFGSREAELRRLRDLARLAQRILDERADSKLEGCQRLVLRLLKEGFHPIVWCRYIATAEYVGEMIETYLHQHFPSASVTLVTSRQGDEERQQKLNEVDAENPRVLVATDCLSEGIDLQEKFSAAIHYDLPWNPNRLEQREGRVDRFGQTATTVKTIRYFGANNPVDGVVLEILLNKAREIYNTLGTHVPVPEESESVTEALINSLLLRTQKETYAAPSLFEDDDPLGNQVKRFHQGWDEATRREKVNRTRFAQRAIKPEEVQKELEAADAVLGDPEAVRAFVLNAAQRLQITLERDRKRPDVYWANVSEVARATLPEAIQETLPPPRLGKWAVSFVSPTPEGAEYLGRNHRFVATLARFLMEEALTRKGQAKAARCGVLATRSVAKPATLLLLRVRYLIERPEGHPMLSEEVRVLGFEGEPGRPAWLPDDQALRLLAGAQADANVAPEEKQRRTEELLQAWPALEKAAEPTIRERAKELEAAHKRVRQAVSLRVREWSLKPQLPPDLLGLLILLPAEGRP